jgi:hypothetical protein
MIRLLTDLLDPATAPADELATLYHERWEAELSNRQIKTYQRGPQEILRSATPDLEPVRSRDLGFPNRYRRSWSSW